MTDEEIRALAEEAGFCGVEVWWRESIPRFRKMLELHSLDQGHVPLTDAESLVEQIKEMEEALRKKGYRSERREDEHREMG